MNLDFDKLIYTILILLIGFFLRDLYSWIKRKILRNKPRISVRHECKWRSAFDTNPRKYKFDNVITIQNIDTEPIYDINLYFIEKGEKKSILFKELLSPSEKIIDKKEIITTYGDSGNNYEEALSQLPDQIRNPLVLVEYKNKNENKFSLKKQF